MKRIVSIFIIGIVAAFGSLDAQIRVGQIFIERENVFKPGGKDWFFASPLFNSLHTITHEYVVKDEILFKEDELVEEDYLFETERNLRKLGLFTKVRIELDSVKDDTYDIYLVTQDRWSTYPSLLFGSGGGAENYGARLEEFNLAGTGTYLALEGLYRKESNIGMQGILNLKQGRLFRTELSLEAGILAHKFRTEQDVSLSMPYRTLETPIAWGVHGSNKFGKDLLYNTSDSLIKMSMKEQIGEIWFSKAWQRKDRVFFTAYASWQKAERDSLFSRGLDNTGSVLLSFSSNAQDFYSIENVNSYTPEDVAVGGYGSATLGKLFPIASGGENLYYVAGQGERSFYINNLYLFGQITGASGFRGGQGAYTYQEFLGLGFYRFSHSLVSAFRIRQQTVWNWYGLRQLILDNDGGLRGYDLNKLSGDNRIIANLEMRLFPKWNFALFDISAAAFWDIGAVWRQNSPLSKTKLHNAAGLGTRLHFTKSDNPNHTFRIDIAYNFDEKKFGGIIFTTQQMFNVFSNHEYRLPKLYGIDFDYE